MVENLEDIEEHEKENKQSTIICIWGFCCPLGPHDLDVLDTQALGFSVREAVIL